MEESSNNTEKRAEIRRKKNISPEYLLEQCINQEGAQKTGWYTTPGSRHKVQQKQVISEFYESDWVGHRGTWETFAKIKQKYWWKNMYKYVVEFAKCFKKCQI